MARRIMILAADEWRVMLPDGAYIVGCIFFG